MRIAANEKDKFKQLLNTIGKLNREHFNPLYEPDHKIVDEFIANPKLFLDNSPLLCFELKMLYDKRQQQISDRKEMGMKHINNVTEKDIKAAGLSQREFDQVKKLMIMDPLIFADKHSKVASPTPYEYTVDLSKYEKTKIPQDCKEMLYRP